MFNLYAEIVNDFFDDIQDNEQFKTAIKKRNSTSFHSVKRGVNIRKLWHHLFEE